MMRALKRFCAFGYDLLFGDDWVQALGVVVAVSVTAILVAHGVNAWWLLPIAMVVLLVESLARAIRRSRP